MERRRDTMTDTLMGGISPDRREDCVLSARLLRGLAACALLAGLLGQAAWAGEERPTAGDNPAAAAAGQPADAAQTAADEGDKGSQAEAAEGPIEEIVSIGTRVRGRTVANTPVPVDVVNSESLALTGQTEVGRMLQRLVPSFNFSSSTVSDGTDALRPATLRGLGPDQTLVLVNGKRRHLSALVHVNTSVGRGTAGVDMNAFPSASIKRIEVLRDGAAALYGSDAIAGVINIVLQDRVGEGVARTQWGQTYKADGDQFLANLNYGIAIRDSGFINFTAEYRHRGATNRAGLDGTRQYPYINEEDPECNFGAGPDCQLDPREFTFNRLSHRIGDAKSEQKSFAVNGEIPFSDTGTFYFFGTYSGRKNESAGFYRRVVDFARTVTELYPDGFLPMIRTNIRDWQIVEGLRWELDDGWYIDLSGNVGENNFDFTTFNSLNASLGKFSPTEADTGALNYGLTSINADFSKPVAIGDRELNVAFGGEYRRETYKIVPSEPAAVINGGEVNTNCPGCDPAKGGTPIPYAAGFQVFKGFSPANAVNEDRDSFALYLDLESDVTPDLTLSAAGRFEHFSDFGSTINGKFATRYQVNDALALRGAISTGFRAPSMQQKFFNSTSTQFVDIGGVVVPVERGTFRNDSELARALGIPKLKEETSFNISAGFVANPLPEMTVTVDFYRIAINDRIAITGGIGGDKFPQEVQDALEAAGASQAQFFINAADTKTRGVDIVITYDVALDNGGTINFSAAANFTDTDIKKGSVVPPALLAGFETVIFTPQDRSILTQWQPKNREVLTAVYRKGPITFTISGQRFGSYTVCEGACDNPNEGPGQNIQKFSAKWLTDVQFDYELGTSGLVLTIGANNLFDVTPDKNKIGQARGGTIPGIVSSPGIFKFSRRAAPFGFNGGLYYGRVTYNF